MFSTMIYTVIAITFSTFIIAAALQDEGIE
jgi:hypothetical protein